MKSTEIKDECDEKLYECASCHPPILQRRGKGTVWILSIRSVPEVNARLDEAIDSSGGEYASCNLSMLKRSGKVTVDIV